MADNIKKAAQRNLPLSSKYELIDSFHSDLENGNVCDNCSKPIANIAVIKDEKGKTFYVGMDCAKTLTNLKGLHLAEYEFGEAKQIRAKVNKAKKEGKSYSFYNHYNGKIVIEINGSSAYWLEPIFVKKHLPDYFNAISNPEKNGFVAMPNDSVKISDFTPIQTNQAKVFFETPRFYKVTDFEVKVSFEFDGKNHHFVVEVFKNGESIGRKTTYMVKDINYYTAILINQYNFKEFNK